MSNEELVALLQGGDRDKLLELWAQIGRMALKQANRWAVFRSGGAEHSGAFSTQHERGE